MLTHGSTTVKHKGDFQTCSFYHLNDSMLLKAFVCGLMTCQNVVSAHQSAQVLDTRAFAICSRRRVWFFSLPSEVYQLRRIWRLECNKCGASCRDVKQQRQKISSRLPDELVFFGDQAENSENRSKHQPSVGTPSVKVVWWLHRATNHTWNSVIVLHCLDVGARTTCIQR